MYLIRRELAEKHHAALGMINNQFPMMGNDQYDEHLSLLHWRKQMSVPLVVYHNNCSDGLGAAWVAKKYFNAQEIEPEFLGANYGDDTEKLFPLMTGRDVYVLDFSFKRDLMIQMQKIAKSFTVLDHHKTAMDDCTGLTFCTFDMDHSGAFLAWQYFYPGVPTPEMVLYIEDRDLWKWKLAHSQEINSVIQGTEKTFDAYDILAQRLESDRLDVFKEGQTILKLKDGHIQAAIKHPIKMTIGGHVVKAINNPNLISETLEALSQNEPFAAAFFLRDDGSNKWQFSLRSKFPNVLHALDVSQIAKQYGGGGHPAAAGFDIPFEALGDFLGKSK